MDEMGTSTMHYYMMEWHVHGQFCRLMLIVPDINLSKTVTKWFGCGSNKCITIEWLVNNFPVHAGSASLTYQRHIHNCGYICTNSQEPGWLSEKEKK